MLGILQGMCRICTTWSVLCSNLEFWKSGPIQIWQATPKWIACKQQGVAGWCASGVDHGEEGLGCTRVVATYAALVEGIAALQPLRRANSRGYRQVKFLRMLRKWFWASEKRIFSGTFLVCFLSALVFLYVINILRKCT